jgi:hypothetical protein
MRKKTMKGAADLQKRMDDYEKKPFYKKKYVMNRTNSLAEMKRIYVWLTGTKKGVYEFEARLKEEFPGAKRMRGKNVEWYFSQDALWEFLLADPRFVKVIEARRVSDFEELCARAYVY